MAEAFNGIWEWDSGLPLGTAKLSQADDQLRGIKNAVEDSFPGITGPVTTTHDRLNSLVDYVHTGPTVEVRLAALEALLGDITAAELATLDGIDTSLTIESRFDAVASWIGPITTDELSGLAGYIIGNGTIEDRLQILLDAINDISGGGPSNSELAAAIDANTAWISGRAAVSTHDQIAAISTFHNTALPSGEGYIVNDLGQNIQLLAQKMENVEDQLGTGGDSSCMFHNVIAASNRINVPTQSGTTSNWGFTIRGAEPSANLDYRFYANSQWGNWVSFTSLAGTKMYQASLTGDGFSSVRFAAGTSGLGPGGGSLPSSGFGEVQVRFTKRDGGEALFNQDVAYV